MAVQIRADFTPALAALRRITPTPQMIRNAQRKEAAKTARATISEMSRAIKIGLSGKYTKGRLGWSILPDGLEVFAHPKKTRISGAHFKVGKVGKMISTTFRGKGGVKFSRRAVRIINGQYTPNLPVVNRERRKPKAILAPWSVDVRFNGVAENVARKVLPKHLERVGARLEREVQRNAKR